MNITTWFRPSKEAKAREMKANQFASGAEIKRIGRKKRKHGGNRNG